MSGSVCILYGLAEGPATGRRFVAACQRAGFEMTNDPAAADIIFAHSGGCLLVPPAGKATLTILVGVPYWPGRLWIVCTVVKVWREFRIYHEQHRLRQWARKWTYHTRYMVNLRAGLHMAANLGIDKPWNSSGRQIIIRNHHDVYSSPLILNLPFNGPRMFVSLPGEHDDCWDSPEPYINLLQSLLKHL